MVWIVVGAGVLDDPARRAGERLRRRLQGAAVHARVQLHDADLPDRRAELRQRPRRRADRAGRRAGDRRHRLATRCAPPPTRRRRNNLEGVFNAIFRGIGQLFFANSIWAGIIIIVGIAVCSRIAAGFASSARRSGMLTGLALGANGVAIYNGLWGFNSFDAALAVGGVFFVLTLAVGDPRRRLRRARRDAVRRDRLALHPLGPARPDAALLLRDAGVRAAEGRLDEARAGRGRGHHDARGAPRALAARTRRASAATPSPSPRQSIEVEELAMPQEPVPAGQHQEVHRPEARRAQPLASGHPADGERPARRRLPRRLP